MSDPGGPNRSGAPGHPALLDHPSSWGDRSGQGPDDRRTPGARPAGDRATAPRRTSADPVKALMDHHRALCERAVDPLEIAAGLEAHGITDRTAARFRHRDVFSLAEEMYARTPRAGAAGPPTVPPPRAPAAWLARTLLPGALCAATVIGLHLTHGGPRLTTAVVGALTIGPAARAAVRRGPLRVPGRSRPAGLCAWWLVGYALLGEGLLRAAVAGGPDGLPTGTADGPWPVTTAPFLALALACAPAAWTAHLFARGARRGLTASRGLDDFAATVRPLLLGALAVFLAALTLLLTLTGAVLGEPAAYPQALTLGALLLLARLLAVHGFTHAPAVVLAVTATAQATAVALLFAARLPGCDALAAPVEALITAWGPAAVPVTTCGAGALALFAHAIRRLATASAHARTELPC
ncbi:hypothetical protein SUDANB58_03859 [Streptomyces sp. enrichment culture]|uniref:hypothetical protein n=1 Tax=Streptomyces sp. enrichment culture TaxID=1795815 RepID=UPI003F57F107